MARLLVVEDNPELASLIAQACEARGHTARTELTAAGALGAVADEQTDFAIVDLHLPDMPGSEVLARLKDRKVPAIAISGVYKGDRFAQEATSVHGAAAFFEKPFLMDSLLEAVDKILGQLMPLSPDGPPSELPFHEDDELLEALEPLPEDNGADVPFSQRGRVWSHAPDAPPAPSRSELPAWTKAGNLAETSVPRLLNAYYEARHDGELKLRQGNILKAIFFEGGCPVYAASNLLHERFGQFCARLGLLDGGQLAAVGRVAREKKLRTATAMVEMGLLTEERRVALLLEQVREIIWSAFSWTQGQYQLSSVKPQRTDLVKLSVFPGDLILQGVSRTGTLASLREKMAVSRKLFPALESPYPLYELSLSGPQASLVAQADGTKTVADLLSLTDLPEREALSTLVGLEWTGLLQERADEGPRSRISFGL